MDEQNWLVNVWLIRALRLAILILGWSSMTIMIVLASGSFDLFSTYTVQSNLLVLAWLSVAIIFQEKNKNHWFFSQVVRGAITLYITVTFIIFALLLSFLYQPTGIAAFTNLVSHYLVPILFLLDWFLTELRRKYAWKYTVMWLAYPVFYLIFTLVRGYYTSDYIYYFIDPNLLGLELFIGAVTIIAGFFIGLGALLVLLNKKLGQYGSKE
ncbi:MAG: hypothetical protein EU536_04420 [Promethearchaeota archaeon]|nr:MAG: hypothetical protein EU536_04420 [Candidatus Lokiarchaeota archaeon]